MPKHVFFDLDNTLTPSRALMQTNHASLFERLCREREVVVVTGGEEAQIRKQIPVDPHGNFFMLSQQGNFAVHKNGSPLWHETVTQQQEKAVRALGLKITQEFAEREGVTPNMNDIF